MLPHADDELSAIVDGAEAFMAEHEYGASIFVAELLSELRTAVEAARRVDHAVDAGDQLGSHVYLRVVIESAMRLRWVAGDDTEPVADVLRERIERQRGRDLSRLRAALDLLPESSGRTAAIALVNLEQASVRARSAPASIKQLAITEEGQLLHRVHRMCSALIHPGIGIRRIEMMDATGPRDLAASALNLAVAIAATSAGVLDRAL